MAKPRKKYKPRGVNPLAHMVAMHGACLLTRDDVLAFSQDVVGAVDAVSKGKATLADWQAIFTAINMMEEMVLMKLAMDEDGAVGAMQNAVASILNRINDQGIKAVRATELALLRDLSATYTDLIAQLTHAQFFQVGERVDRKIAMAISTGRGARFIKEPTT